MLSSDMTLLDDIRADQAELDERVEGLLTQMTSNAREAVESHHHCMPVVSALVGVANTPKLYRPHWDNEYEMDAVFTEINDALSALNASASVTLIPSQWTPREEGPDGMTILHPSKPAILIITRTTAWRRVTVLPYDIHTQGEVEWDTPHEESDFEGGLITVPEVN